MDRLEFELTVNIEKEKVQKVISEIVDIMKSNALTVEQSAGVIGLMQKGLLEMISEHKRYNVEVINKTLN